MDSIYLGLWYGIYIRAFKTYITCHLMFKLKKKMPWSKKFKSELNITSGTVYIGAFVGQKTKVHWHVSNIYSIFHLAFSVHWWTPCV